MATPFELRHFIAAQSRVYERCSPGRYKIEFYPDVAAIDLLGLDPDTLRITKQTTLFMPSRVTLTKLWEKPLSVEVLVKCAVRIANAPLLFEPFRAGAGVVIQTIGPTTERWQWRLQDGPPCPAHVSGLITCDMLYTPPNLFLYEGGRTWVHV